MSRVGSDSKSKSSVNRLAILLAMAMFVLVVDTSLMNVSISAVVDDLGVTVSQVQAAIALEALTSAAFILFSGKLGDIIGRKRAYTLGLIGYGIGAAAMVVAQNMTTVIIFWSIVGGLGAALLLPAMQSLIHGNFSGGDRKKAYAVVGAAAGIAAAVGPLLGGFVTTYTSWRVGFLLEAIIIAVVLLNLGLVRDTPYTGPRRIDVFGALLSVLGMGGLVVSIIVWQEGGEAVGALLAIGVAGLISLGYWLNHRRRQGKTMLLDPALLRLPHFRLGISQQMLQQITLGGAMIALPIFLQMTLEYNAMQAGLSIAPLSLTMFGVAILAGRKAGKIRASTLVKYGFILAAIGLVLVIPLVPRVDSGWALLLPMAITGTGLGLLVSQLNNYTLGPIPSQRVSEAASINSASGTFGLSFGLAMAGGILLAVLSMSFTNMTKASTVLQPDQQQRIAEVLEEDAQVMQDSQLQQLLKEQPKETADEILRINSEARDISLQIALMVPVLACLVGIFNAFRMGRLPDIKPSAAAENASLE